MESSKKYTGIDLLDAVFEFVGLTPAPAQWNARALQSNPPRLIRFKQIESLLSAFFEEKSSLTLMDKAKQFLSPPKKQGIQSVLSGDFLKDRSIDDYGELIQLIQKVVKEKDGPLDKISAIQIPHLLMPYQQLIKYKQQLRDLLRFNAGWLEVSSASSWFSICVTDSISSHLKGQYGDLDLALELFINPRKLSFTEATLKEHYKFPLDNLSDIDMDYY